MGKVVLPITHSRPGALDSKSVVLVSFPSLTALRCGKLCAFGRRENDDRPSACLQSLFRWIAIGAEAEYHASEFG